MPLERIRESLVNELQGLQAGLQGQAEKLNQLCKRHADSVSLMELFASQRERDLVVAELADIENEIMRTSLVLRGAREAATLDEAAANMMDIVQDLWHGVAVPDTLASYLDAMRIKATPDIYALAHRIVEAMPMAGTASPDPAPVAAVGDSA